MSEGHGLPVPRIASRRRLLQATGSALLLPAQVRAQPAPWPSRPIRLVVGFGAGGIADTIARTLGVRLTERLGQPVIVDNRPGAGGALAARLVSSAQPDGHTVLVTTAAISVNANAGREAIDPTSALTPIVNAADTPSIFAVHGANRSKGMMDFARAAKDARFTYGTAGIGTTEHLMSEFLFRGVAGIEATHVPFASGLAASSAVIAQQVDMTVTAIPTVSGQVRSNALRVLAVSSKARMLLLPDVQTLREAGFADFENTTWIGVFGPPKLPSATAERINEALNAVLKLPDVRERLVGLGFDPRGGTADGFASYVKAEVEKWARVIRSTGIAPA